MSSAESSQGLPPLSSPGTFNPYASAIIDAPRDVVWRVLIDWNSYNEWNPFVRNVQLVDASKRQLPVGQVPRVFDRLYMSPVHIPPSFDPPAIFPASSAFVKITVFDSNNYRCAWETMDYSPWLLSTVRWQALTEVVEDGRTKTRYESREAFNGPLAYVVKVFIGNGLIKSFIAMAEGLKKRAEELATTL